MFAIIGVVVVVVVVVVDPLFSTPQNLRS